MDNELNDFEQDEVETFAGPSALLVNEGDAYGVLFLIPLDVPLPLELKDIPMPTGPLVARLQPLGVETSPDDVALLPISGPELLALSRAWSLLKVAKKIAVLSDLPGAREDVIFAQARRQIGLKTVEWASLAEAFSKRQVERQRTSDKSPWLGKTEHATSEEKKPLREAGSKNLRSAARQMPKPEASDEDTADL
jgi:hypothetical protein